MKSNENQLKNRGYIPTGDEKKYINATFEQRIAFLQSTTSTERTIGARLLTNYSNPLAIHYLATALKQENKLYSKIAICDSIASFGIEAVPILIDLLGLVGNNQHKKITSEIFKKNNYPLPRDISSRILIRIGPLALPFLLNVLSDNNPIKISEAIDAIGFICYYNYQDQYFEHLKKCYNKHHDNELIKWKIFRAMSAFPESQFFLNEQLQIPDNLIHATEIQRSIYLIKKCVDEN